ncbi:hypothetical protein HBN99_10180 [Pseudomonas oryzihabitans]|nr:hypothetical protein [Pseudomonas oryzihabitans]
MGGDCCIALSLQNNVPGLFQVLVVFLLLLGLHPLQAILGRGQGVLLLGKSQIRAAIDGLGNLSKARLVLPGCLTQHVSHVVACFLIGDLVEKNRLAYLSLARIAVLLDPLLNLARTGVVSGNRQQWRTEVVQLFGEVGLA